MKRIVPIILALTLMLFAASAIADSSSVDLIVSLMVSVLPEETDDYKVDLYYDEDADVVVVDWQMKTIESEAYITYAPLLQSQISSLFDSVCTTTESMKDLLTTSGCDQGALGLITTSDGVPIAVFYNGVEITSVK